MVKKESINLVKKSIFLISSLVLIVFLLYSVISKDSANSMFMDIVMAQLLLGLIYLCDRRFNLSIQAIIFLCTALLLNPIGVIGMYSHFIYIGVFGYDKFVHLFMTFAITYGFLDAYKGKKTFLIFAIAVLMTMGFSSLNEINEFIGQRYFNVDNGGMFTLDDTLPQIKTDLQRYDTYFDMIFNLAGSLVAALVVFLNNRTSQTKKKKRHAGM